MFRSFLGSFAFIVLLFSVDIYFFQGVKYVIHDVSSRSRTTLFVLYWLISAATVVSFLVFAHTQPELLGRKVRAYLFALVIGLFLAKVVGVLFLFVDDVRRLFQWILSKLFSNGEHVGLSAESGISRSAFLSWMGIGVGSLLFGSLVYGFSNKYRYNVKPVSLFFPNLPDSFDGLKVVQISDVHSGSFTNKKAVQRGIDLILQQKPDLILFTGDLVNDMAIEMKNWMDVFSQLRAPLGVYSVLGNHDYGDYVEWPNHGITHAQNLENLKNVHSLLGWRLLMNEHVLLERNGEKIALLGVENWGAKARFPKYGRLDAAHAGTENIPFKILMSHDPSHWDAQIRPEFPDISLTLSGHTHGMQFGVELPHFKWSPVEYVYKEWAGLYETDGQKLYVNRGFGFIGYPGRVGILPEITLLQLRRGTAPSQT